MKKLMTLKFLLLVLISTNTFAAANLPKKLARTLFACALTTFGYGDEMEGVENTLEDLKEKMREALDKGVEPSELLATFDEETTPGSPSYESFALACAAIKSRREVVKKGLKEVKGELKALIKEEVSEAETEKRMTAPLPSPYDSSAGFGSSSAESSMRSIEGFVSGPPSRVLLRGKKSKRDSKMLLRKALRAAGQIKNCGAPALPAYVVPAYVVGGSENITEAVTVSV